MGPKLVRGIAFAFGALMVYIAGSDIPTPGIDPVALKQLFLGRGPEVLFNMW
jgi:preprotein translocase subunit SecY